MILRELYYFDRTTTEKSDDDSYSAEYDQTPVDATDTRKTRLTLRQINRIRKASDFHNTETTKELESIKLMYSNASAMVAGAPGGI